MEYSYKKGNIIFSFYGYFLHNSHHTAKNYEKWQDPYKYEWQSRGEKVVRADSQLMPILELPNKDFKATTKELSLQTTRKLDKIYKTTPSEHVSR